MKINATTTTTITTTTANNNKNYNNNKNEPKQIVTINTMHAILICLNTSSLNGRST